MSNHIEKIKSGATTAFIDSTNKSSAAYKPEFVANDHTKGVKVLTSIEDEFRRCDSFTFSVAFITLGGITPLLQTLQELERKGIPGRILTTDYNNFTDPKALDKLASFKNIELRMYQVQGGENIGFHTKGYIFKKDETYTFIIGSANMTDRALAVNKEWNTKLVSTEEGEMYKNITAEFNKLWSDANHTRPYDEFIDEYRIRYETIKRQKKIALEYAKKSEEDSADNNSQIVSLEQYKLSPNKMQIGFINNLKTLVEQGENKALLISATGTGKTYASAFGVRDAMSHNKRVLFLVHREQIAKQAMKSYKNVFGRTRRFGLLSGNSRETNVDFLFATMQMMSKEDIYKSFSVDYFQTIIIDEAHHVGASSYQKIMAYFKPKFWLGMTASPERTDSYDVFDTFDHNIALEIRLQQAMEENLLCPFHYFGITDYEIDGEVVDDNTGLKNFNRLIVDERVDYIIQQIEYYGYSGDRVKGLIFCSDTKEAKALSEMFNSRGYKTAALTGSDSQEEREKTIDLLTKDINLDDKENQEYLDYIFTVDIFNEGVDIPEINQVVMLRPTESAIIFVQQLGRGLRKYIDKEFVVIIDFIGNYLNNFLIPIALSGDRTYNKDNLRKYVMEGSNVIPGISSVHFDEISKKRIFESIDASSTPLKILKEKYQNLKFKLGKTPNIVEFYKYGEIDPILFIEYIKGSYDKFVRKVDDEAKLPSFTDSQSATLDFVSMNLASGKRIHELILLKELIHKRFIQLEDFKEELKRYHVAGRNEDIESAIRFLSMEFTNTQSEKEKYKDVQIIKSYSDGKDGLYSLNHSKLNKERIDHMMTICESYLCGYSSIQEKHYLKELSNIIDYGMLRYDDYYSDVDEDNLVLYQKYSRKDVCRILNWERDDSATVYGYRIKYGTCPIFVTYEKNDNISESTKYPDQFIDNATFSWMTRNNVRVDSRESQEIINHEKNGLKIYLFIKKSDGEGSDFYYMGKVNPEDYNQTTIKGKTGKDLPIMNFVMKLEHPVRNDIYEYFTK
jgi:superfamily II DNA or RNA helicase